MEIKKTLILDVDDPLSKALSGVLDTGIAVIVTRKGRYYGIIDDRNLKLFHIQNPSKVKCETVIAKPPVLYQDTGLLERTDAFLLGHFKALPVVAENDKPLGLTTRVELLQDMLKNRLMPKMGVKELMNSPVYTIDYKENVGEAKLKMKRYKARRLVVTRMGKPIGTFSTLDLTVDALKPIKKEGMAAVISSKSSYDDRILADVCRPDFTTVPADSTVEDAAKKMIRKSVSSVIVLSGSKPLGVLSALDIFKFIKEAAGERMQIGISGLKDDNRRFYNDINESVSKVVERFGESFGIRRVNVHVKEGKSVYSVKIHVEGNRENFSTSTEGPSMRETVDMAVSELRKVLARKKGIQKSRKVLKKGGLL